MSRKRKESLAVRGRDRTGNTNLALPGYYILFIINTSGVPSVASFVRLQQ